MGLGLLKRSSRLEKMVTFWEMVIENPKWFFCGEKRNTFFGHEVSC